MDQKEIKYFIEAALLAAGRPLSIDQLQNLFDGRSTPEKAEIRAGIEALNDDYDERGIEIQEVASGFRMQVSASMADRLQKLWEERPPRYSRALFETLALIAYRQPITRGEIEEVRGVAVSSNIVRTLMERDWVRVVGHRDVPGRPAMFGTTKLFLDYFGLKKLDDLPPLADLSDWESLRVQLDLPEVSEDSDEDLPEAEPTADIPHLVVPVDDDSDDSGESALEEDDGDPYPEEPEFHVDLPELEPLIDEETGEVKAIRTVGPASAEPLEPEERSDSDSADAGLRAAATDSDAAVPVADDGIIVDDELMVSEWPDPVESGRG